MTLTGLLIFASLGSFAYGASLDYPIEPYASGSCALCPGSSSIYCVNLATESPIGTFVGMHVQFDSVRRLPILSHTLLNSLNHQHTAPRNDSFRRHPCAGIYDRQCECKDAYRQTPEQQAYANQAATPFDRGHLTPSHPFTYSSDANHETFYCVNIAPQDGFTNRGPWAKVEEVVLDYFKAPKAGYVMTGVCDSDATGLHSPTLAGFPVPSCFWKMTCYRDTSGTTRVVGFISENSIIPTGDTNAQSVRRSGTYTPRSQTDVLNRMSINRRAVITEAWATGAAALVAGRNEVNAPSATQCMNAMTLATAVRDEWAAFFPK